MPSNGNSGGEPKKRPNPLAQMKIDAENKARERIAQMEQDANELIERFQEEGFSYGEAMAEFEQSREMAKLTRDANAMTAATVAKSKLSGLWIEKQAVLHAHQRLPTDLTGDTREKMDLVFDQIRERIGSKITDELLEFLRARGLVADDYGRPVPALPPR